MKKGVRIFLIIILVLIIIWFLIRLISPREIDDVSPDRNCEKEYLEKSEILWVIPLLNNISIAENKTWCNEILAMNKTLGLHGITHSYHEFELNNISQNELDLGIKEFGKCFGYKPRLFKPPYLYINKQNKKLIKENDLILKYRFNQEIHKVYHCNNSGTLPNLFHDVF